MAVSPILKVYDSKDNYVASCKYLQDAALLAGHYGIGARVKKGHNGKTLWHEGYEIDEALNSVDVAAEIMKQRWN